MNEAALPKNWHAAVAVTRTGLAWREESDGRLVLGEDFPTVPQPGKPVIAATPNPDFSTLATLPVPNPAQSPEQQRGEWVHAALQGLTVAAPAAARAEALALAARVKTEFPWLFGPESLAEVAVVLPHGGIGRIDRVVPHAGALWLIDFKTGVPSTPTPANYVAQLQSYAAALAGTVQPNQPLRLGLVWVEATPVPTLVELPVSG